MSSNPAIATATATGLDTDSTAGEFRRRFNRAPEALAAAPGRVNLIGEHTDYNGGFVLPMAINRECRVALRPNDSNECVIHSAERREEHRFSLCDLDPTPRGNFADYVRGVVAGFCERGASVPGFDAVISSDVPLGSGLSSSAALEVATATALEQLLDHRLPPLEKALLCQRAEHLFVGVPCGLMDQYAAVFGRDGHLVLLDCRSNESQAIPFADPDVEVLVVNSNVRHQLAESEYALRRQACESAAAKLGTSLLREVDRETLDRDADQLTDVELRRARHVLSEDQRTLATVAAIRERDWEEAGRQMYASHDSLRDDYEVSCAELDVIVEICRSIGPAGGVLGARMTGGGFGGCAIALVKTAEVTRISDRINRDYEKRTEIRPTLFTVRAGPGARVLAAPDLP